MSISIKELISQGKTIQEGLKYIPPREMSIRSYRVYCLANMDDYYRWKESAIRFLQVYDNDATDRFVKYSELFENKHYAPEYLSNMVGVLDACDTMPSDKQIEQEKLLAKDQEISEVERLEQVYLGFRTYVREKINSAEAIDAFHKWHAAASILFDKWFYGSDDDLVKFQSIDSGGNGYTLSTEYNTVYTPYCKLMSRLKDGRDIKRVSQIRASGLKGKGIVIPRKKINIFISYAHSDAIWLEKLETHLKVLSKYYDNVETWVDTKLRGGDKWREEITNAIKMANVAILLVSTAFLASDFITSDELPPILRKAEEDGTRVLPLIVSPCEFEDSEIGDFQAVNSPDKTLADLRDNEAAIERVYLDLNKEIKSLIA